MKLGMAMQEEIKKTLGRLAGASITKMGDVIIFTTVAGWLASSAAQIYGISVNKNYKHEQKKYMINQEVFDAITNICLYFSITKSLTMLSSLMVKTAKLAPKSIVDFMRRTNIIDNRGKLGFDITQARDFNKEGLRGKYNAFKCFADASAATIGGIVSSNIITPIVRNQVAAHRQNKYKAKLEKLSNNTEFTTLDNFPKAVNNPQQALPRHTFNDFKSRVLSI